MVNFRFNLDVTYRNKEDAKKATELIKKGKKVHQSLYYPDETSIYISASINKVYCKKNTGLKIKPINFDVKTQSIKTRDAKSLQLQSVLNKIKDDCLRYYRDLILSETEITVPIVQNILIKVVNPANQESKKRTFFDVYDEFYSWKVKTVKPATLPRYVSLKKHLVSFEKVTKKRIELENIDKRFSDEFSLFLIDTIDITKNTISKYLKSLKCFMGYCLENELSKNNKYKQIKAPEEITSIFVLETHEIEKLWNLELTNPNLKTVRDMFCFLCYTGQRYSDLTRLEVKDIFKKDNHSVWRLFQYKTKATSHIDIPLLPDAQRIIDQHCVGKNQTELIFKVIPNQTMNDYLKIIGKMAKIEGTFTTKRIQGNKLVEITVDRAQKISTHTGRKSFITNAIKKGVPITVIQKISGHASLKSMRHYIEMSESFVAETLFDCFKN